MLRYTRVTSGSPASIPLSTDLEVPSSYLKAFFAFPSA